MSYVLITPARNEAETIELTIRSVINQTVRPYRWVIVNDGSSDRTAEVVKKHAAQHGWIELINSKPREGRDFAGKVAAFEIGRAKLNAFSYDIIGNIDADISFEDDFFEFLLRQLSENPRVGIGGAPFQESDQVYDFRFSSIEHVSGACQLFRRECYEQIGGYLPIRGGGIDVAAVLTARMKGWETKTFVAKRYIHHRKMGTANSSLLTSRFRNGKKDFVLGSHPVWEFMRSIYQMTRQPYFVGAIALLMGYLSAMIRREKKLLPHELVAFRRHDEMHRLISFLRRSSSHLFRQRSS